MHIVGRFVIITLAQNNMSSGNRLMTIFDSAVIAIVTLFLLAVILLSSKVSKLSEIHSELRFENDEYRAVRVKNSFDRDVMMYFDDGEAGSYEAGSYLATMQTQEQLELQASTGDIIYCTDPKNFETEKLATITILKDIDEYILSSTGSHGVPANRAIHWKRTKDNIKQKEDHHHTSHHHPAGHHQKSKKQKEDEENGRADESEQEDRRLQHASDIQSRGGINNRTSDAVEKQAAERMEFRIGANKGRYIVAARTETRPNPAVTVMRQRTTAMSAKFRSMSTRNIDMFFDNGADGLNVGHLRLAQETSTNTYEGHVFFFTVSGNKSEEIARFRMTNDQVLYVVYDRTHPAPAHILEETRKEEKYMSEYYNSTGIHWRHYFGPKGPRGPPQSYMWPANRIGDVHMVETTEGFWSCESPKSQCQSTQPFIMELEVVSQYPRAFIIENFLSDFEASEIIRIAKPRLSKSSVGQEDTGILDSDTRTSRTGWLPRKSSAVTESLFLRAADLLQIDERWLTMTGNTEDLQVVNYKKGQKYDAHHDWGVSGYPESRYITLLLYLTDMASPHSGGETSFPKGAGGEGMKIIPKKGRAALFYNLLEDGNGDDLSLHAALPVVDGEKWLANLWVWDPRIKL